MSGAIINATGLDNGVTVFGVKDASGEGIHRQGALGEGILVVSSTGITVDWNIVKGQRRSAPRRRRTSSARQRTPVWWATAVMASTCCQSPARGCSITQSSSTQAEYCSLTSSARPTATLSAATSSWSNALHSGIKLSGQSPNGVDASNYPTPKLGGVYANTVSGNIVMTNGLVGSGGGIVLTVGVKGGACYSNLVNGNEISGNGLSGITIRRDFGLSDVSGDQLFDNWIGTNNLDGDAGDQSTTGIYVVRGSPAIPPVSVTVFDNTVDFNHYGLLDTATPGLTRFGNHFVRDVVDLAF